MHQPLSWALRALTATALAAAGTFAVQAAPQPPGHTYYVSPSGSTSSSGSKSSPFLNIQQCATVMVAGDTCVIASGTYRETVTPAHSGTARAPITYEAAPGAQVVVDGTDTVSGWNQVSSSDLSTLEASDQYLAGSPFASGVNGGHVYQTQITLNPKLPGNQIFVNGNPGVEAQWPYPGTNPLEPQMATAQSGTYTSVSDSALTQPAGYWTGARLTARNWFITETAPVTSSSVGSVTASSLTDCVSLSPNDTTSYSLSNKLELLGQGGEWFYQASSHTLYFWAPNGGDPSSYTVEAKQRELGFDLSGTSYTTLNDVNVRATSVQTSASSTHDTINGMAGEYLSAYDDLTQDPNMVTTPDDCAFLTAGESTSGIVLNGTDNTIENSDLNWSAGNGVALMGSHNTATNNTITNVDYMGSYAAGINLIGQDETITHNTVAQVGRSDLNIDNKMTGETVSGENISYNDLSGFNNLVDDGGAIYACCSIDLAGSEFDHNILHSPAPLASDAPAPGIYLDNNTYNATIYDNVTYGGTTYGVVLFNGNQSSGDDVYNNTAGQDTNAVSFFGSTYSGLNVSNNIGNVATQAGVTENDNLQYSTDPLFTAPLDNDYTVQPSSPARNAAQVIPPATNGYKDPKPTIGAYQYGAPQWTAGSTVPTTLVQAERWTNENGVSRHAAGTGEVLGNFNGGSEAEYDSVNFGSGRNWFTASVGADPSYAGQSFAIHIDSATGPVIGTMEMVSTGGFDTYQTESIPIVPTSGVHNVYLVGLGSSPGIGNIDYFAFQSIAAAR